MRHENREPLNRREWEHFFLLLEYMADQYGPADLGVVLNQVSNALGEEAVKSLAALKVGLEDLV